MLLIPPSHHYYYYSFNFDLIIVSWMTYLYTVYTYVFILLWCNSPTAAYVFSCRSPPRPASSSLACWTRHLLIGSGSTPAAHPTPQPILSCPQKAQQYTAALFAAATSTGYDCSAGSWSQIRRKQEVQQAILYIQPTARKKDKKQCFLNSIKLYIDVNNCPKLPSLVHFIIFVITSSAHHKWVCLGAVQKWRHQNFARNPNATGASP